MPDIYTIKIVGSCTMIMSITPYWALVQISAILLFLDLHSQYSELQKKATLPLLCTIGEHGKIDGGLEMMLPICS